MVDNNSSRLDRFRSSSPSGLPSDGPQLAVNNDNEPYCAYIESRTGRAESLLIYFSRKADDVGVYLLSHMTEIRSPNHQHLVMSFGTAAIIMKGRNLTKIALLMHERKLHTLQPYHPERFSEPTEGEPIITMMKRASLTDALPTMENQAPKAA